MRIPVFFMILCLKGGNCVALDKILVGEGYFYDSSAVVFTFSVRGDDWWQEIGKNTIYVPKVGDTLMTHDRPGFCSLWLVKKIAVDTLYGRYTEESHDDRLSCSLIKRMEAPRCVNRPETVMQSEYGSAKLVFKYSPRMRGKMCSDQEEIIRNGLSNVITNTAQPKESINLSTGVGKNYTICKSSYRSVCKYMLQLGERTFAYIFDYHPQSDCPEYATNRVIEITGDEYVVIWEFGAC